MTRDLPTSVKLAGIPVTDLSLEAASSRIVRWAQERRGVDIHLCNSATIAQAMRDEEYHAVLGEATINLADGWPIARWMKLLDPQSSGRAIRGPDLFRETLSAAVSVNLRSFFLGCTPAALPNLDSALSDLDPRLRNSSYYAPPFQDFDSADYADMSKRIIDSGADIVWIGLGTPKQDFAAHALASAVERPCVCVGAAFDFVAGVWPEAPELLRHSGFEWVWRLASEPRRLSARYALAARLVPPAIVKSALQRNGTAE